MIRKNPSISRRRISSEEIPFLSKEMVLKHNGIIISGSADSAKTEIEVECVAGHRFKTDYDRLKQGKWCRLCGYIQSAQKQYGYTVEELQLIASQRGGEFLSSQFLGAKKNHEFRCEKHGSFWATPDKIKNSTQWCRKCWNERRNKDKLLPIDDVDKYVTQRGGKITNVSEYQNRNSRVQVECHNGHSWFVTAIQLISAKSWCPHCKSLNYMGETITRSIFEATYRTPFPKSKPEWLKTQRGGCLELDGYNEDIGVAFEYQGPYHQNPNQILRDNEKRKRCESHDVILIEIPYIVNPYPYEKVRIVIEQILAKIDPNRTVVLPEGELFPSKLKELQELAKSKGGYLVTDQYLGETTNHTWKCNNPNHPTWNAQPYNIKRSYWCAHCAPNAPKNIDWLQEFAKEHYLIIDTDQYHGANEKYRWICLKGDIFYGTTNSILQRVNKGLNACSICAKTSRHISIQDLQRVAELHGGQCLSKEYNNAIALMLWRCRYGHEFYRQWNKVQQGYWCTVKNCEDNRNWGIHDRFSI